MKSSCQVWLKMFLKFIIQEPKTAVLGPQFCRILVLGPHFLGLGRTCPPGSAPVVVVGEVK